MSEKRCPECGSKIGPKEFIKTEGKTDIYKRSCSNCFFYYNVDELDNILFNPIEPEEIHFNELTLETLLAELGVYNKNDFHNLCSLYNPQEP